MGNGRYAATLFVFNTKATRAHRAAAAQPASTSPQHPHTHKTRRSYKEWFAFNNQQRAHYNLVENFPGALTLQVLAGLYFPRVSSGLAVLWIAARHVWAKNYISGGPENRYSGLAGLHIVSVLGWFGMAVAGGLKLTGLVSF